MNNIHHRHCHKNPDKNLIFNNFKLYGIYDNEENTKSNRYKRT